MTSFYNNPLRLAVFICLLSIFSLRAHGQEHDTAKPVGTAMRNIHYHFTDTIDISIASLDGKLVPQGNHEFPVFDDSGSFALAIDTAEMSISADAMTHLLNDYTFAKIDAPLKKLSVSISGGTIKVKGVLHSKGDLPFESEGAITVTPDGLLRIHATKIKAAHLPAKGIMDLFGIEISDLVKTNKVQGLKVDKDDLILDPQQLFPPPAIRGRVSTVSLEGNNIRLTFGKPQQGKWAPLGNVRNYMSYRGGTLRFGKLTMADTDLTLIDEDQRDPFDFYLSHYQKQLVAGYSKTTPQSGLLVYMPDYGKVRMARAKATDRKLGK
jgi:hypothetical protein